MSHRFRSLALCSAVTLTAPLAAQAQVVAPLAAADSTYAYHVTDVIVGSAVPQAVLNGPVPFDKTYAALTPAQKAVLNQDYENLAAGDEPPFPRYGVRHLIQPLMPYIETYGPVGPVVASVEVDAKGDAKVVKVFESPDPQLTRILGGAMALEKYKPATCHGEPCQTAYVLRMEISDLHGLPVTEAAFHHYDRNTANFSWR